MNGKGDNNRSDPQAFRRGYEAIRWDAEQGKGEAQEVATVNTETLGFLRAMEAESTKQTEAMYRACGLPAHLVRAQDPPEGQTRSGRAKPIRGQGHQSRKQLHGHKASH